MKALDTNVLVRYLAQDDPKQSAKATAYIEALSGDDPAFIPLCSLIELVWVMESCYDIGKPNTVETLWKLLRTQEFIVENAETAIQALRRFTSSKAEFSDCLIERSANHAGCAYTVTFDQTAAKSAGMQLLE